jgi:hypothetical protein
VLIIIRDCRRKHRRGDSPTAGAMEVPQDGGDGDDEQIKSRRLGSLGRIIANTALVVERTESGSRLPPKIDLEALTKIRQGILANFFQAFNLGDMTGLAKLVQEQCSETCELWTPDLPDHIMGRASIMMLFSLCFENFPDGIYRELPMPPTNQQHHPDPFADNIHVVSTRYAFSGTRVFDPPIAELYAQVVEHWTSVQEQGLIHEGTLIDNMAYSWIPEGREAAMHSNSSSGSRPAGTAMDVDSSNSVAVVSDNSDKIMLQRSSHGISPTNSFQFNGGIPSPPATSPLATSPLGGSKIFKTGFVPSSGAVSSINNHYVGSNGAGLQLSTAVASSSSVATSSSSAAVGSLPLSSSLQSSMSSMSLYRTASSQQMQRINSAVSSSSSATGGHKHGKSPAWLKKLAKSLSTSFGSVAGKISSSLTLKERQTKHKRVMHFEFDVSPENLITKITILPL